jgi:c-di-GMP-binding flagellar brake protein YcgR
VEARRTSRGELQESERFRIRLVKDQLEVEGTVIDVSPFGMGASFPQELTCDLLTCGDVVAIQYLLEDIALYEFKAKIVHISNQFEGRQPVQKVGLAFLTDKTVSNKPENRSSERIQCPSMVSIQCECENPLQSTEKAYFQVVNIGKGGLSLAASTRHKFLVADMVLSFAIKMPFATHRVQARIRHIQVEPSGRSYVVGVEFISPSVHFQKDLSSFVLSFLPLEQSTQQGKLPALSLREEGLAVENALHEADFASILSLRLHCNQQAGFLTQETNPDQMADRFDAFSRHLFIKNKGITIACCRVIFVQGSKDRSETQEHIHLPDFLWKEKFVEFSGFYVAPQLKNSSLIFELLSHAIRIAFEANIRYIIMRIPERNLHQFQKFGAKEFEIFLAANNLPKAELAFSNEKHNIAMLDAENILKGKQISFENWQNFVSPWTEEFHRKGILDFGFSTQIKLAYAQWKQKKQPLSAIAQS